MERSSRALRAWRLLRLGLHIARGVITAATMLPWASPALRLGLIREWSQKLLSLLGVSASIRGTPLDAASARVMVVANHVSWLDIYLLNSVRPLRFVSKSEVRSWPVVGWLAAKTGTLFLERARRRDAARVNDAVTAALNHGDCVAFFPEGTTTDGTHLRPFLAPLLQPAVDAGATLQPVALRYVLPDGSRDAAPAYFGNMSLGESLTKVLARREIHAEIAFLDPIACVGQNRRELAKQAEAAISSALNLAAPRTTPETAGDPPAAAR